MTSRNRTARALIVEDEYVVALAIGHELRSLGFEIVGPAARLREATRLAAEADGLAIAVLDIGLQRDESWPVARKLRDRGVPFFFLTGHPRRDLRLPSDLEEAEICFKPLDPDRFRDVVERLARSPAGRTDSRRRSGS
jgi:DNA-binding response OmpR family regulator